jgi:hypothetical protein
MFIVHSYSAFQISDGEGGDAEAQANAVFVSTYLDMRTTDFARILILFL